MHELYMSRYVDLPLRDLADALGPRQVAAGSTTVDFGDPTRVHGHLWLIPVVGRRGAATVLQGHLRAIAVRTGRCPVSELLLVGDGAAEVAVLLETVIDELLGERPSPPAAPSSAPCPPSTGPWAGADRARARPRVDVELTP